jgi:hypothetical protein
MPPVATTATMTATGTNAAALKLSRISGAGTPEILDDH